MGLLAVLVILGIVIANPTGDTDRGANSSSAGRPKKSEPQKSPEYQLAMINAGTWVPEDHIHVTRFRFLLDSIKRKAKGSPSRRDVADAIVRASQLLKERYGREVKILELAEGANKAIPESATNTISVAEVLAAMIVLMGEG